MYHGVRVATRVLQTLCPPVSGGARAISFQLSSDYPGIILYLASSTYFSVRVQGGPFSLAGKTVVGVY